MKTSYPHVVIVDDEVQILDTLTDHLEHFNYKCSTFSDPQVAHDFVLNEPSVSIVITDIRMPAIDGIDLTQRLKEFNPDIPIMVMTAYGDMKLTIKALRAGASDYISKPFDLKEIKYSIDRICNQNHRGQRYNEMLSYSTNSYIKLVIPSYKVDISLISVYISSHLYSLGFFNLTEKLNFSLAINEAVTNSNDHGNLELSSHLKDSEFEGQDHYTVKKQERLKDEKYKSRTLTITIKTNLSTAEVVIEDEGNGFDVNELIKEKDPLNIFMSEENHGRGLTLMQLYSDELDYNEKGNIVTITKFKQDL